MNIKWEEGAPAPVSRHGHTAVWLNGLVYVGGGSKPISSVTFTSSYIINCYDPVNNSWSFSINTACCDFAITTLNNKLVIAGGQDRSYKKTTQVFTPDAGQLKNYTKMVTARSLATAAGHQGMLIITGGWVGMIRTRNYPLLNYLTVTMASGTSVVIYHNHTSH